MKKKGISLITLVVTIIVIIIIAGAVLLSMSHNDPTESATEAKVKQDVDTFRSELALAVTNMVINGEPVSNINTDNYSLDDLIPSSKGRKLNNVEYKDILVVENGNLYLNEFGKQDTIEKEYNWLKEIFGSNVVEKVQISQPTVFTVSNNGRMITATASGATASDENVTLHYEYRVNNVRSWTEVAQEESFTYRARLGTTNIVYVRATDGDGHYSSPKASSPIIIEGLSTVALTVGSSYDATQFINSKADITISHDAEEGYILRYKIGENGIWQNIEGTSKLVEIRENTIIYADLYNESENDEQGLNSVEISKIDNELPTGSITSITGYEVASVVLGATITVTSSDGISGMDYAGSKVEFTTSSDLIGTDGTLYTDGVLSESTSTISKTKAPGTYYAHVLLKDIAGNLNEVVSSDTVTVTGKKDFDYSGDVQNITLPEGNYKLEVWGAQGGYGYSNSVGGKGGYSTGDISLLEATNMFVLVGGYPGANTNRAGGYNGGGSGNSNRTDNGGGGGATDIRIGQNSLYARVIVAGGGAGGNHSGGNAGYGGGTVSGGTHSSTIYSAGNGGSFGQGCNVVANSSYPNGGAGGGWYGGGGITGAKSAYESSGGGTGWVYTLSNYNTWKAGNATDANKYELKDKPEYYLSNAETKAGNVQFASPKGASETGHTENGYARITCLD